jgi:hypothetical protein
MTCVRIAGQYLVIGFSTVKSNDSKESEQFDNPSRNSAEMSVILKV